MARIRTIKPDFWTDGTMISLSFEARLFYIGTWNFALCDHGHLPDDALGLKLKILPADNVDPQAILGELMTAGRLVRLRLPDGRTFLHIVRLDEHQKIDARWQSRCPVCSYLAETHASSSETHRDSAELETTHLGGERKGKERKGGEGAPAFHAEAEPPLRCSAHSNSTRPPACGLCKDARVAHEAWEKAQTSTAPQKSSAWRPGLCRDHLQAEDSCEMCVYENAHAAKVLYGQFGNGAA
jgi:hypothetical protein